MKYKKILIIALTVIFASCGGSPFVVSAVATVANLSNGLMLVPAVY
jgi:hypothetical protein